MTKQLPQGPLRQWQGLRGLSRNLRHVHRQCNPLHQLYGKDLQRCGHVRGRMSGWQVRRWQGVRSLQRILQDLCHWSGDMQQLLSGSRP